MACYLNLHQPDTEFFLRTETIRVNDGSSGRWLAILPRTFDHAITACFFVVIMGMACLMPMQNDSWWHLRAGQEMWTRRFIMLADEFSFTVNGAHWPNHEWLSEVVFYALYWLGGLPALTLFAALCVTLATALAWRLMAGAPAERLLFMGVAMASIAPVWTVRPHIFTLLLLLVTVHLALLRRYWPIPLLFLVWANLHGGVALGLVALAGVMTGRAYLAWPAVAAARGAGAGASQVKPLLLTMAAGFGATCVTPLGGSLWWRIPESIHKSSVNQIVEWQPPSLFDPTYLAFWAVAAAVVVSTWTNRSRIRTDRHAALIGIALALLPLALRSRRNVPPFLLVALPALTYNLADSLARWRDGRSRDAGTVHAWRLNTGFVGASVLVCTVIVGVAWSRPAPRLQWQPLPQPVLDDAQECGDRVFNRYPDGGPLIWFAPRVRVFIDSRQDPYPLSFTQEYIRVEQTGEYAAVFERYGIRCAMLPDDSRIATRLKNDGWRTRVHHDGWSVLESPAPRTPARLR